MAHIVILGAGIGGIPCAYELRRKLDAAHRITLVGSSPHFEFTPSNPWVAVGWRQQHQVRVELAEPMRRRGVEFIGQQASAIDPANNSVTLADGTRLEYDHLVVATGPALAFDEIPGLGPPSQGGHTHSICTQEHALEAWVAYQDFLRDPGPIVIGAAQGASCFGPAYEFAMIIDADLRRRKLRDKVPMTYVTAEPYIGHMGLGGVGDSKGLMESELRQRHIQWVTNAKIAAVRAGAMEVVPHDDGGQPLAGRTLAFRFAMVLPAFRGVPAVAALQEACNPRGFVKIDSHQRSPVHRNLWSAGVCVAIPPVEVTPVPVGAPKTGYMIESMVSAIAENIASELAGKPAVAEGTWNAICLADFGDTGAAFVALPQIPPRNVTWARRGKWVHLAKIAFEKYFLHKVRSGSIAPVYETYVLKALGILSLKEVHK